MILTFIACIGGLLCILASVYDWDWFFENYRARLFVTLFGREGARVFYLILGIILIIGTIFGTAAFI